MKATLGIDPGKNGAIACISEHGIFSETFKEESIASVIREIAGTQYGTDLICYIEKVNAFPGQGVSSCFAFGKAYGEAIGALEALAIPYRLVTPQAWQKTILGLPRKKDGATAHKRALKLEAARRFPKAKPTLADCDALLIAEYGHRDRT